MEQIGPSQIELVAQWGVDEDAVKTLVVPGFLQDAGNTLLVCISNESATVGLSAQLTNSIHYEGLDAAVSTELVAATDFAVPAGTAKSKVVRGFANGVDGAIVLSKSAAAAAAFAARVVVRRA